jgi:hypothetical protein
LLPSFELWQRVIANQTEGNVLLSAACFAAREADGRAFQLKHFRSTTSNQLETLQ